MPFVSRQQEKWAFANKMPFAEKWAKMTDQKNLPDEVKTTEKKKIIKKVIKKKSNEQAKNN